VEDLAAGWLDGLPSAQLLSYGQSYQNYSIQVIIFEWAIKVKLTAFKNMSLAMAYFSGIWS
jgi:hypothetical protein